MRQVAYIVHQRDRVIEWNLCLTPPTSSQVGSSHALTVQLLRLYDHVLWHAKEEGEPANLVRELGVT